MLGWQRREEAPGVQMSWRLDWLAIAWDSEKVMAVFVINK